MTWIWKPNGSAAPPPGATATVPRRITDTWGLHPGPVVGGFFCGAATAAVAATASTVKPKRSVLNIFYLLEGVSTLTATIPPVRNRATNAA